MNPSSKGMRMPQSCPVRLMFCAYLRPPQTIVKKLARGEPVAAPTKRPDLGNLIKLLEDALRGAVYTDDALIVIPLGKMLPMNGVTNRKVQLRATVALSPMAVPENVGMGNAVSGQFDDAMSLLMRAV